MSEYIRHDNLNPDVLQSLGRIDLIAKVLADSTRQGLHRSKLRGSGTDFSDYKSYDPGDDLRHLDWRLYARTDKLYIKRFETYTNLQVHIIIDTSLSMGWRYEEDINKLEYSTNLAAAIMELFISQQDPIGLTFAQEEHIAHLPPKSKKVQLQEMYALLESMECIKEESIDKVVEEVVRLKNQSGPIIIFTDLEEAPDQLEHTLDMLAGLEEEIILFHILDYNEIELPFKHLTHLEDIETGVEYPVHYPTLKEDHVEQVEVFRNHWEGYCNQRNITFMPIDTEMNYLEVLLDLFAEREAFSR